MASDKMVDNVLGVGIALALIPVIDGFITTANLTGSLALVASLIPLVIIFGLVKASSSAFRKGK